MKVFITVLNAWILMWYFLLDMMFAEHLVVFNLLVALERLRGSQDINDRELGLFINGVDTSDIEDDIVFDEKPDWISNKVCKSVI